MNMKYFNKETIKDKVNQHMDDFPMSELIPYTYSQGIEETTNAKSKKIRKRKTKILIVSEKFIKDYEDLTGIFNQQEQNQFHIKKEI